MKKIVLFIFLVLGVVSSAEAARTITNVTLNGSSSVTVSGGSTVTARVYVTTTGTSNADKRWRSTSWRIGSSGNYTCVDHDNFNNAGNHNIAFNITAPNTIGAYNVSFIAHNDNGCQSNGASAAYTLNNGITVNALGQFSGTNTRAFAEVFKANTNGNIKVIGNTILGREVSECVRYEQVCNWFWCWQECAEYSTQTSCPGNDTNNADITTKYFDIDGDPSTFSSTSAELSIPANAKVLKAILYWQGLGQTNDISKARTIKLKTPTTNEYINLSPDSDKFNWTTDNAGYPYQGSADITQYVEKSGTYTVADLFTRQGKVSGLGTFGAWSIVVAYENEDETLKNMTIYDGYDIVDEDNQKSYTLSGFITPTSGDISSRFLVFAGEGDVDITGDYIEINGTKLNAIKGTTNSFSASITDNGAYVSTKTPNCQNNIGIDIDFYNVGNTGGGQDIIKHKQTSASIKLGSTQDRYFPSVFAFSTDLYTPDVCYEEKIYKDGSLLSGSVEIGDLLDINVTVRNKGQEPAIGVTVEKQYDPQMPYVSSSMLVRNTGQSSFFFKTDDVDEDTAEYTDENGTTKYYIGTGATGGQGGNLNEDNNASFSYKVSVDEYINHSIKNKYLVSYQNDQLGVPFVGVPMSTCSGVAPTPIVIRNPNELTQCGIFPDAISSHTDIIMQNGVTTVLNSGSSLATPSLTNHNGSTCDGTVCSADTNATRYTLALPTFYTSSVTDTAFITNSATFEDENVGDIVLQGTPAVTPLKLTFNAPDSSSYGKNVMFIKGITNNFGSGSVVELEFHEGDYWIGELNLQGNGTSKITTVGKVRFFVNNDIHLNSPDFEMDSNPNAYIFAYNGFRTQSNNSSNFNNVYIYSKGEVFFNSPDENNITFKGAIASEQKVTLQLKKGGTFTYEDSVLYDDGYGDCGGALSPYLRYHYDAWELGGSLGSPNIYTKLAGNTFSLVLAVLNEEKTALAQSKAEVTVSIVSVENDDAPPIELKTLVYQNETFNDESMKNISLSTSSVARKARIKIVNTDPDAVHCTALTPCYSSDLFSIRPSHFTFTDVGVGSGELRAGDFSTFIDQEDIKALNTLGTDAMDYNTTTAVMDLNISIDMTDKSCESNTTAALFDKIRKMPSDTNESYTGIDINMTDGVLRNSFEISFKDVGELDVNTTVTDRDWTTVDQPNDCVVDSNSTTPDANGKVGCLVKSMTNFKATVLPYQLDIKLDSDINAVGFGVDTFTYYGEKGNDFSKYLNLGFDITTQAKDGNTTKNYDKDCFAEYDALTDINITVDTNQSGVKDFVIYWDFEGKKDNKRLNDEREVQIKDLNVTKESFTKGVADKNLKFILDVELQDTQNGSRKIPKNPMKIDGNDTKLFFELNSSLASLSDIGSTVESAYKSTDNNITYYFARLVPIDVKTTENSASVPFYIDVYCSSNCGYYGLSDKSKVYPSNWYQFSDNDSIEEIATFGVGDAEIHKGSTIGNIINFPKTDNSFYGRARIDINHNDNNNTHLYYNPYSDNNVTRFYIDFIDGTARAQEDDVVNNEGANTRGSKRIDW